MKKVIPIVVFLLLIKPVMPVADYIINYDYISKVLCVNKEKPELECNGKCHLKKGLAKAAEESSDKQNPQEKKNFQPQQEVLICQQIENLLLEQTFFMNSKKGNNNYSNLYFRLYSCAVFHPPTVLT